MALREKDGKVPGKIAHNEVVGNRERDLTAEKKEVGAAVRKAQITGEDTTEKEAEKAEKKEEPQRSFFEKITDAQLAVPAVIITAAFTALGAITSLAITSDPTAGAAVGAASALFFTLATIYDMQ